MYVCMYACECMYFVFHVHNKLSKEKIKGMYLHELSASWA